MHGNPLSVCVCQHKLIAISPNLKFRSVCEYVCVCVLQATQGTEVSLGTFHPSDITNSLTSLTLQSPT